MPSILPLLRLHLRRSSSLPCRIPNITHTYHIVLLPFSRIGYEPGAYELFHSYRVTRCFHSDLAVAEAFVRALFTSAPQLLPHSSTPATTLHPVTPLSRIFTRICASVLPDITSFRAHYSTFSSALTDRTTTRRSLWLTQHKLLLPSISTINTRVDQADRHLVELTCSSNPILELGNPDLTHTI